MSEFEEYRNREANLTLAKKLTVGVWIVTVVVLALVGMMRLVTVELPEGVSLGFLPPFHALLNSCAAVCLVLALKAIKGNRVVDERREPSDNEAIQLRDPEELSWTGANGTARTRLRSRA